MTVCVKGASIRRMAIVDTAELKVVQRLPGWRGRSFNSLNMTFVHYEFDAGASIHRHHHEQEEVWNVLEGELEVTIDGVAQVARAGMVPSRHRTRRTRCAPSPLAALSWSTRRSVPDSTDRLTR
jgi:mannose-6-phosphate isomerase-like protein (cupin superfamily)